MLPLSGHHGTAQTRTAVRILQSEMLRTHRRARAPSNTISGRRTIWLAALLGGSGLGKKHGCGRDAVTTLTPRPCKTLLAQWCAGH